MRDPTGHAGLRGTARAALILTALCAIVAGWLADTAGARRFLYFTQVTSIRQVSQILRAPLTRRSPEDAQVVLATEHVHERWKGEVGDLTANRHGIYFTLTVGPPSLLPQRGWIGHATLRGHQLNQQLINGLLAPHDLVADARHLFWLDESPDGSVIGRANLDGSHVRRNYIGPLPGSARALALSHGVLYFALSQGPARDSMSVGRVRRNGDGLRVNLHQNHATANQLAVSGLHIYFTKDSAIWRMGLNGASPLPLLQRGTITSGSMAIAGGDLYFSYRTDNGTPPLDNGVGRIGLRDGRVTENYFSDIGSFAIGPGP